MQRFVSIQELAVGLVKTLIMFLNANSCGGKATGARVAKCYKTSSNFETGQRTEKDTVWLARILFKNGGNFSL